MTPAAWIVLIAAVAVFAVAGWAFCVAAARGDSDLLRPHDDELLDEPALVVDIETGEPIRDLDAWCVSVSPDRRRPA